MLCLIGAGIEGFHAALLFRAAGRADGPSEAPVSAAQAAVQELSAAPCSEIGIVLVLVALAKPVHDRQSAADRAVALRPQGPVTCFPIVLGDKVVCQGTKNCGEGKLACQNKACRVQPLESGKSGEPFCVRVNHCPQKILRESRVPPLGKKGFNSRLAWQKALLLSKKRQVALKARHNMGPHPGKFRVREKAYPAG